MRLNFTGFTSSNGTLVVPALIDHPDVANELSVDYEAGYRSTITTNFSVDLAAYYDRYSRLNTTKNPRRLFSRVSQFLRISSYLQLTEISCMARRTELKGSEPGK